MEGALQACEVLIIAEGGRIDELAKPLLVVSAVGVGRRVLADEKGVADDRILLGLDDGGEDAVQGVVVGGGNRVELMVVATRAGHGQSEETLGRRIDTLVDGVVVILEALADGDEAEGSEARVVLGQVRQAVGGKLLDDELVVGLIGIERVDDVVTVGPRGFESLDRAVFLESLSVGITGGIEPVAGPAFAVVRRSQEAIHGALDDGGRGAGRLAFTQGQRVHRQSRIILAGKGVDFHAGGRKADQVIGKAAEQRFAVGGLTRHEAFLVELGQHEGVDLVLTPSGVAQLGRHGDLADRLEGPVTAGLIGKTRELGATGADRSGRAHLDPLLKRSDLRVGKLGALLARRHRKFGIGLMDGNDQEGLLHVTRDDGRAKIATRQHARARIHDQPTLGDALLLRVTLIATLGKNRADVLLEEFQTGGVHLRLDGRIGGLQHGDRP